MIIHTGNWHQSDLAKEKQISFVTSFTKFNKNEYFIIMKYFDITAILSEKIVEKLDFSECQ